MCGIGVGLVTLVYLMTNLAFILVLTPEQAGHCLLCFNPLTTTRYFYHHQFCNYICDYQYVFLHR